VYKIAEQNLDNGEKVEIIEKTFDEFIDFIIYKDVRVNREFVIEILKMKID